MDHTLHYIYAAVGLTLVLVGYVKVVMMPLLDTFA